MKRIFEFFVAISLVLVLVIGTWLLVDFSSFEDIFFKDTQQGQIQPNEPSTGDDQDSVFLPAIAPLSDFEIDGETIDAYHGYANAIILPSSYSLDADGNIVEGTDFFLKYIGNFAFLKNMTIQKVEIPEGFISLGNHVFEGCFSLEKVTMPSTLTFIGDYAFQNCASLTSITIPESVSSLGAYAFAYDCRLTDVYFGNNHLLEKIPSYCFQSCLSLSMITIPDSVTSIGIYAFENTYALKAFNFPQNLTSISAYAFNNSGVEKVILPEGLVDLGKYAFFNGVYNEISLPSTLTNILSYTFYSDNLKKIVLPATVTSCSSSSFMNCSNVEVFIFESETPLEIQTYFFGNANCVKYVPDTALESYKSANVWSTFAETIKPRSEYVEA